MAIFHKTLQYHEDTTEKRDISQEDIEFLKKLQLEMNTQDTTGTADPRFWVIKGSERVINNEDPDELCLQVDGSTVTSTTEETVKYLNDNILPDCNIDRGCKIETGYTWDFKLTYTEDGEEEYDDLSTQEVNEFLANNGHDDTMIIGISIRPFMYPNTMFLTEKEAREHLKRNYYHYSEDAHTYCMVAWRSPEVEKLWKILRETKWDCKDKELESHEEKYILHYCISLMQELVGYFEEWYRWVHGENAIEELSEEERFCYNMSYFHIVQELFLFRTYHSGGTSTMAKCKQLGVDSSENVEFKFEEEAGAVTIVVLFTLWCIVSIERVRKEREISAYAALCGRIQEQINETRDRISSVKMHLYVTDHNLDQAILRWKYEYLIKQEQWLIELMCGKIEEEKQEEKQ